MTLFGPLVGNITSQINNATFWEIPEGTHYSVTSASRLLSGTGSQWP